MRKFYAALPTGSLVGIESTGYAQWFQCLLVELGHQLWIGDAAELRAASVRQQKTDTRDARFLLQLLLKIVSRASGFPRRRVARRGVCCCIV